MDVADARLLQREIEIDGGFVTKSEQRFWPDSDSGPTFIFIHVYRFLTRPRLSRLSALLCSETMRALVMRGRKLRHRFHQ